MLSIESKTALAKLGEQLRRLRLSRNDRQADFAARLGVSIPTLRKLEQGDPSVAIGTWVDAIWLLDRIGELKNLLASRESLFDQWEQQAKAQTRKRASKK